MGVNGSRRWCLNCGAEWPTAVEFLAEVNNNRDHSDTVPTRTELQQRFMEILARLEEQDGQLGQIDLWLKELENRLVTARSNSPTEETDEQVTDTTSIMEYA